MDPARATVALCSALWSAVSLPFAPTAALAQVAPAPVAAPADEDGEVVVTGRRGQDPSPHAAVRAISGMRDGQLARFEDPVCPATIGLPLSHGAVVESGIRALAEAAGIAVAPRGCVPNLTVIVAADGAAVLDRLRKQRPRLFASLTNDELRRLRGTPGPAWSWREITPKRRDGGAVQMIAQLQVDGGTPMPVDKGGYIVENVQLGRLSEPVRLDVDRAFVLLDAARLGGLTLRQVADHAGLLGLAAIRTGLAEALARPSILTLFGDLAAGRAPAPGATAFDLAYLAGLYAGEAGVSGDRKIGEIAGRIRRAATR